MTKTIDILGIIEEIEDIVEGDVYLVGGAVRDILMGNQDIQDLDFATPLNINDIIQKLKDKDIIIDSDSVYHEHGVVQFNVSSIDIELSQFRKYNKGQRRIDADVKADSILDDLKRRDLTINSMYMDSNGFICDPLGGIDDLNNGLIRFIGDAEERINEDPVRILRAIRFKNRFNFKYESNTIAAIEQNLELINQISNERIISEFKKAFTDGIGFFKDLINLLHEHGDEENILNELTLLVGFNQNNPYHQYDLLGHTLKALECNQGDFLSNMALLYHDIGKPATEFDEGGISRYFGHQDVSVDIFKKSIFFKGMSKVERGKICEMIKLHDRQVELSKKAIRKLNSQLKYNTVQDIINIQIADKMAQSELNEPEVQRLLKLLDLNNEIDNEITLKDMPLNGFDVKEMGYSGKDVGKVLDQMFDIFLNDIDISKEDLLEKFMEKHGEDKFFANIDIDTKEDL